MTAMRRAAVESIGTGFLLTAIVGSGITASRLAPGSAGLELLINSTATGAAIVALIAAYFPGFATRLHWSFADPAAFEGAADEKLVKTRVVRDEIRAKVEELCAAICPRVSVSQTN